MPLLPGKKNIGHNIATEEAAGKPRKQAIAIALDVARRTAKASGGAVQGYADGGAPKRDDYLEALLGRSGDKEMEDVLGPAPAPSPISMPNSKKARRVQEHAMRGRELPDDLKAFLEAEAPGKEARGVLPGAIGSIGAELTGIPSLMRMPGAVSEAVDNPSPANVGRVGLETMGAVPGLGIGARSGNIGKAFNSLGRMTLPVGAAGAGLTVGAGAANATNFGDLWEAGKREGGSLLDSLINQKDPYQPLTFEQFRDKRLPPLPSDTAVAEAARKATMESPAYLDMDKTNPRSSTWARNQLVEKAIVQALAAAQRDRANRASEEKGLQGEYDKYVQALAKQKATDMAQPFVARHPLASGALAGVATAVPLALGYRTHSHLVRESNTLLEALDKARRAGDTLGEASALAALKELNAGWNKSLAGAVAEGAAVTPAARFTPDALDALFVAPSENKDIPSAGDKAWERWKLENLPHYFASMAPAAVEGGLETLAGMAGSRIMRHQPARARSEPASMPPAPMVVPEGMSLDTMAQDIAKRRTATATGDADLYDALSAAHKSHKSLLQASEDVAPTVHGSSRSAGTASKAPEAPSPSPVPASQPGVSATSPKSPTSPIEPPNPSPSLGSSPNPSEPPKPRQGYYRVKEHERKLPSRKSNGEEGKKNGGRIARALQVARRAMGGRVHVGPVTHKADGGRTDTIPVDLPQSSYVIPADIVSSLGEGDTNAGYKVLTRMFGAPVTRAEGGGVPAIIAGGEYVLSPEQVAQIGGGDPNAGFKALDQWVKVQRRKTIQTLKGLPGPAQD